jgi:hypothetical protein
MPLSPLNGITVRQWLESKGFPTEIEPNGALRITVPAERVRESKDAPGAMVERSDADVLVQPGGFIVATYVKDEDTTFLHVSMRPPKPEADEPASVG